MSDLQEQIDALKERVERLERPRSTKPPIIEIRYRCPVCGGEAGESCDTDLTKDGLRWCRNPECGWEETYLDKLRNSPVWLMRF